MPKKVYEIREGNGKDGCYRRGTIEAVTAKEALILAHRLSMISTPPDVRPTIDIEGDDEQAYLVSYVGGGESGCRWCAEANDIAAIEKRLQEFSKKGE